MATLSLLTRELSPSRTGCIALSCARGWPVCPAFGGPLIHSRPLNKCRGFGRLDAYTQSVALQFELIAAAEIIRKSIEMRGEGRLAPDERLMRRRACEYEIFQSVEEAFEMPHILAGFSSIESFVARAQTILQRRKARSGRSLELHAKAIFVEESLVEGRDFAHQPESEPGKKPDFLFPSAAAYRDPDFPAGRLRMLAVKTTCKDRWRQILNEADRIPNKHLLTLQEGVSETQFAEMRRAGVTLVVPKPLRRSFAKSIQPHLLSLEHFIRDARSAALQ